jgi:hypothetical protein
MQIKAMRKILANRNRHPSDTLDIFAWIFTGAGKTYLKLVISGL